MILADTNIIIDYLKGVDAGFHELLIKGEIAVCGVIIAELLHGVKSEKEKHHIAEALKELDHVPIDDSIWTDVGNNLNKLKKKGCSIPFQDAVIATLCIKNNIPLLTKDNHFKIISKILPLELLKVTGKG